MLYKIMFNNIRMIKIKFYKMLWNNEKNQFDEEE